MSKKHENESVLDEHGNYIGYREYDKKRNMYFYYDNHGRSMGYSEPDRTRPDMYHHYDSHNHYTGYSVKDEDRDMWHNYDRQGYASYTTTNNETNTVFVTGQRSLHNSDSSGACYIATCVYGSYDCPQVWALRRFRDRTLAGTWYGRAFIKAYYAASPGIVRRFGSSERFRNTFRGFLDWAVSILQNRGFESSPYTDAGYRP